MPLEALGRKRKGWREDDTLLADSTALIIWCIRITEMNKDRSNPYLWWHIVERIECRIDVRDEKLRGQRRKQSLSIRSQIWRYLCALPDANLT